MKALEEIYLTRNEKLRHIREEELGRCPNLKRIVANDCDIDTVDAEKLKPLQGVLQELALEDNPLRVATRNAVARFHGPKCTVQID